MKRWPQIKGYAMQQQQQWRLPNQEMAASRSNGYA
jgi:hypothetical protein